MTFSLLVQIVTLAACTAGFEPSIDGQFEEGLERVELDVDESGLLPDALPDPTEPCDRSRIMEDLNRSVRERGLVPLDCMDCYDSCDFDFGICEDECFEYHSEDDELDSCLDGCGTFAENCYSNCIYCS